ncbi:MAG: YggT family protein [Thermomicrobiales bacterium]|nr:YggT family protein [Thermomicrobiales bacterium]MEA2529592.1 YggT family protein [Thermomicrobiales bacterium]MEA2582529.1 YggT family protein [Thermomicrobiales bacterium]MEA2593668.1 YggT family protein [Thermomicrobiales bacterium]
MNDLASLIDLIFTVLTIALIGRALLSWFDPGMRSTIGRLLVDITEPIIGPIRRVVPSVGMFDISPIIALLLLQFLRRLLISAVS